MKRGFTLIELLVVVLLIALVSVMGMRGYQRSMEYSKADQARELVRQLAQAQMHFVTSKSGVPYPVGIVNGCNTNPQPCAFTANACNIFFCGFQTYQDWNQSNTTMDWGYYLLQGSLADCGRNGGVGGGVGGSTARNDPNAPPEVFQGAGASFYVACAVHNRATGNLESQGWIYTVNQNGGLQAWSGADPWPPFQKY